jgi:hypothetical protein
MGGVHISTAAQSAYPPTAEAKRSGLPGRAFAAQTFACKAAAQAQRRAETQSSATTRQSAPHFNPITDNTMSINLIPTNGTNSPPTP